MNATIDFSGSDLSLEGVFNQAISYATTIKEAKAKRKEHKVVLAKKKAKKDFINNLLHSPSNQRAFFENINDFLFKIKNDVVSNFDKKEAIEFCEKFNDPMKLINDLPAAKIPEDFTSLDEFHAYSGALEFIDIISKLFDDINYVALHGPIDENSEEYNSFLKEEIQSILTNNTQKRKSIGSIDDFLTSL